VTRGRRTIVADRDKLIAALSAVENDGPLQTQAKLWAATSAAYNEMEDVPEKISPSVVFLRVKEWELSVKTEPARKRGLSSSPTRTAPQHTGDDALDSLLKTTPDKFRPLARKAAKGSRAAAVKLKCLDCSGYQKIEIKLCTVPGCPLWMFRPYRGKLADKKVHKQEKETEQ
jgi:hypothetical protein